MKPDPKPAPQAVSDTPLGRPAASAAHPFKTRLWVWLLLTVLGLTALGLWLRQTITNNLKAQIRGELQALLNADVAALDIWLREQKANAQAAARDPNVAESVRDLARLARGKEAPRDALLKAPQRAELEKALRPVLSTPGYSGFVALDARARVVAATQGELIGMTLPLPDDVAGFVGQVLDNKPVVTRPFAAQSLLVGKADLPEAGLPTMFAAAPVAAEDGTAVAVLALRIPPDQDFTRILDVARYGASGETYAFDKDGLMLSQSRFGDDYLKELGLISKKPGARSMLHLELRDPGADLTAGEQRPSRHPKPPLNKMVEDAIQGGSDVDVDGHRDYRGVVSLGAWTWLPEYGFGVATEVDRAEAYRPLRTLGVAFRVVFVVLAVLAAALLFSSVVMERLRAAARRAEREARQLGQYTLEEKIGAGGMGMVYRARHALLRRPTAVKLLHPDKAGAAAAARFEREVQQTCRLNHPNTVAIYDYGRTADGTFYYAMEYVEGLDLDALVRNHGPLPDGRVIPVLTQVCGSLAEAHEIGLVHRDVKPANVMLTHRGGTADFVKLLDFGLVKALQAEPQAALTAAGALTGTPGYLSPEVIENPEKVGPRSDLYSLGAVAYYLLTGRPAFLGDNPMEICRQQVQEAPVPPSQCAGRPIAAELEAVILSCLAKRPEDRPATARELAARLASCRPATPWSAADAEAWWKTQPASEPPTEFTYATLDPFPRPTVTFATLDPNKVRPRQGRALGRGPG